MNVEKWIFHTGWIFIFFPQPFFVFCKLLHVFYVGFSHPFLLTWAYLECLQWHWIGSLWQQDFGSCQLCKEWQTNRKLAAFVVVCTWRVPGMSVSFPRERPSVAWQAGMVTRGYSEVCHFRACNFLFESFFRNESLHPLLSLWLCLCTSMRWLDLGWMHLFNANRRWMPDFTAERLAPLQSLGKKAKGHAKYIWNFRRWSGMETARQRIWDLSNE